MDSITGNGVIPIRRLYETIPGNTFLEKVLPLSFQEQAQYLYKTNEEFARFIDILNAQPEGKYSRECLQYRIISRIESLEWASWPCTIIWGCPNCTEKSLSLQERTCKCKTKLFPLIRTKINGIGEDTPYLSDKKYKKILEAWKVQTGVKNPSIRTMRKDKKVSVYLFANYIARAKKVKI